MLRKQTISISIRKHDSKTIGCSSLAEQLTNHALYFPRSPNFDLSLLLLLMSGHENSEHLEFGHCQEDSCMQPFRRSKEEVVHCPRVGQQSSRHVLRRANQVRAVFDSCQSFDSCINPIHILFLLPWHLHGECLSESIASISLVLLHQAIHHSFHYSRRNRSLMCECIQFK